MLFIVFLMFSAFVSKYIKSKETHSCEISLQVDGRNPASDSAKLNGKSRQLILSVEMQFDKTFRQA